MGNRSRILFVSQAEVRMDTMESAPKGMLKRMLWNFGSGVSMLKRVVGVVGLLTESNPKPWMIKGPKAPMPPLGRLKRMKQQEYQLLLHSED